MLASEHLSKDMSILFILASFFNRVGRQKVEKTIMPNINKSFFLLIEGLLKSLNLGEKNGYSKKNIQKSTGWTASY